MTAELNTWCSSVNTDGVTGTDNRRVLTEEESMNGWVRNGTVSTQQLNSLFYYLTLYSAPYANCPYLMSTAAATPSNAYELDGSTFTEEEAPNLYAIYAGTLDDLSSDAPTGYKYVIRIS